MKILINEEVNKKVFGLFQSLIDKEMSELKERYRNEEITASNWYLSIYSRIHKVKVINIKYKPALSVYIDVYAGSHFDEDDVQGFAKYLRDKLSFAGNPWIVPILYELPIFNDDDYINESVNPKVAHIFNDFITKISPELLPENGTLKRVTDGVSFYVKVPKNFGNKLFLGYIDDDFGFSFNKGIFQTTKRLFLETRYVNSLETTFGDMWDDLFLNWFNINYESELKEIFGEDEWEVNSISKVK
jgi:hypothetical protein